MPYKKTYRKRIYKKKVPSRWDNYAGAGRQLVKDVQMLKNLINTEFKFYDTSVNSTATTTPAIVDINATTLGDGPQNHDGMGYRMKSIAGDFNIKIGTTPASCLLRMFWVLDIDSIGATPSYTDIFTQPIAGVPTVVQRNLGNKNRFIILKDKTVSLSTQGQQHVHVKYYRKLDAKVNYDQNGTALRHNRLIFVYTSNVTGANAPIIEGLNRIRFVDN